MTGRALELAEKGRGQVSPGPLVGCVIVDSSGIIVGEGTYYYQDLIHAEVAALEQAGTAARGGTAYISLEPHSHFGKTPPCTDALIRSGVTRVVAPIEDPNPLVSGKGFENLRSAGISVQVGILRREAESLNEKFIHWHKTGRPFVHLKMATSLDGKIATRKGDSKWITSQTARERVQLLRHEFDAILIGRETAEVDDPSLTDRSGLKRNRLLKRVVLDSSLSISLESNLVCTARDLPTVIVCDMAPDLALKAEFEKKGIQIVELEGGGRNISALLAELNRMDVQSVLVEGGGAVAGSFFDAGMIDKVSFFIAPKIIGGSESTGAVGGIGVGFMQESIQIDNAEVTTHGKDIEITGYPVRSDQK